MSQALINDSTLYGIADALRAKLGLSDGDKFKLRAMPDALNSLDVAKFDTQTLVNKSLTSFTDENENSTKLTSIRPYGFSYCLSLHTVILKHCLTVNANGFYNCSALNYVSLPALTSIGQNAFALCRFLSEIHLPAVTSIAANAFFMCSKLQSLYLYSPTMCTLANANAFNATAIANGFGNIYVPESLVNTYKADSVWSNYASQIVAITNYAFVIPGTNNQKIQLSYYAPGASRVNVESGFIEKIIKVPYGTTWTAELTASSSYTPGKFIDPTTGNLVDTISGTVNGFTDVIKVTAATPV